MRHALVTVADQLWPILDGTHHPMAVDEVVRPVNPGALDVINLELDIGGSPD